MARVLADLQEDISALSKADKEELLDFLMRDIGRPPQQLRALVQELDVAIERTSRSLDDTLSYLAGLDERMERERERVREKVLRSTERWTFADPPGVGTDS